mmetsp:Transcript_36014/g.76801  ORF Transcript_36014/g.76801 Transcript_36014/m.76801 type:complete len:87 (-) Transcript_36014:1484-1744(-)
MVLPEVGRAHRLKAVSRALYTTSIPEGSSKARPDDAERSLVRLRFELLLLMLFLTPSGSRREEEDKACPKEVLLSLPIKMPNFEME